MTIWITSDLHFGHKNIAGPTVSNWESGYRNFDSVEEMNDTIISNLNECVTEGDTLYVLGDFAMGPTQLIPEHRKRINCADIRLIYGNHDKAIRGNSSYRDLFTFCKDYHETRHDGVKVCMSHYCQTVWNENGRGSVQLYGHSHGSLPEPPGRQFDVGVDCHDFKPLTLDECVSYATSKPVVTLDNHTSKTSYH